MKPVTSERDCDICGAGERKQITVENGYPISRCVACGFIYVSGFPDSTDGEGICEYYAGTEEEIEENRVRYERVSDFLLAELARQGASGTLLDVGCGYGAFLVKARAAGWDVYGTDLSKIAIDHVSDVLGLANVVRSDLMPGLFGGKRFDAINLTNVLEHVPSPTSTLRICRELLSDDGVLTIRVPNMQLAAVKQRAMVILKPLGLYTAGDLNYLASPPPSHLSGFTSQTLRRLLQKCAFEAVAIKPSKLSGIVNEKLPYRLYESATELVYRISLRTVNISHTMLAVAKKRPV